MNLSKLSRMAVASDLGKYVITPFLMIILLGTKCAQGSQVSESGNGKTVLVMTDLEGVLGIDDVSFAYTHFDYKEFGDVWRQACEHVTQDLNAVVRGLRAGGVADIHVIEGHAFGFPPHIDRNVVESGLQMTSLFEALSPASKFPWESFDGAVLIGLHAMTGIPDGYLSHTISDLVSVKVNERYVGEVALTAWLLRHYGVPTIMVTGDTATIREVNEFLPSAEGFVVKTGTRRDKAVSLPLEETRSRMQEAAMRAVANVKNQGALTVTKPIHIELEFATAQYAVMPSFMPGVRVDNDRSLSYFVRDYHEAYATILTAVLLAESSRSQLLIESLQNNDRIRDAVRLWWMENYGDWATGLPPFSPPKN